MTKQLENREEEVQDFLDLLLENQNVQKYQFDFYFLLNQQPTLINNQDDLFLSNLQFSPLLKKASLMWILLLDIAKEYDEQQWLHQLDQFVKTIKNWLLISEKQFMNMQSKIDVISFNQVIVFCIGYLQETSQQHAQQITSFLDTIQSQLQIINQNEVIVVNHSQNNSSAQKDVIQNYFNQNQQIKFAQFDQKKTFQGHFNNQDKNISLQIIKILKKLDIHNYASYSFLEFKTDFYQSNLTQIISVIGQQKAESVNLISNLLEQNPLMEYKTVAQQEEYHQFENQMFQDIIQEKESFEYNKQFIIIKQDQQIRFNYQLLTKQLESLKIKGNSPWYQIQKYSLQKNKFFQQEEFNSNQNMHNQLSISQKKMRDNRSFYLKIIPKHKEQLNIPSYQQFIQKSISEINYRNDFNYNIDMLTEEHLSISQKLAKIYQDEKFFHEIIHYKVILQKIIKHLNIVFQNKFEIIYEKPFQETQT